MTVRDENGKRVVQALPKTLDEVAAYQRTREYASELQLVDPETGETFGYRATGTEEYELCATFSVPREKSRDLFWNHPAGRHCYRFNARTPP